MFIIEILNLIKPNMNLLRSFKHIISARKIIVKYALINTSSFSFTQSQKQDKHPQKQWRGSQNKDDEKIQTFSKFAVQMGLDKQFKKLHRNQTMHQKQISLTYSFFVGLVILIVMCYVTYVIIQEQAMKNVKLWKAYAELKYLGKNQRENRNRTSIFLGELFYFSDKFISQTRLNANQNLLEFVTFLIPHFKYILASPQQRQNLNQICIKTIYLPQKQLKKQNNILNMQKIIYSLLALQEKLSVEDYCITLCKNGNIRQQYLGFTYLKKFYPKKLNSFDNETTQKIQERIQLNQKQIIQRLQKMKNFQKLSQISYQFDGKRINKLKQFFNK